jgi:hypothetical protein
MAPSKSKKPKSQIDAFRKTARALECDESEERFDGALKKVASGALLKSPSDHHSQNEKPRKKSGK